MRVVGSFLLVAQFLVAITPCSAQERALRLELVSARVRPGAPVFVNAMFFNPGGASVHVIRQIIQFPREKLSFVGARMGLAGNLADAAMLVEMKDESGAKVNDKAAAESLEVTFTAKQTFQEGPLVEFEFRLADLKDQSIRVGHTAEALDDTGKKIPELAVSDAEVVVSEEISSEPRPAIGCFFFTH